MSLWSKKPFVSVRVLGSRGHYPAFEIKTPGHVYCATESLTWMAVTQPALPEDWEFPERVILLPEEIRLLSAILLSEPDPWNNGFPGLDRGESVSLQVPIGERGLLEPGMFARLEAEAAQLALPTVLREHAAGSAPRFNVYDGCSQSDAASLIENIDPQDQLLLAGLARLLGASRLISFADELEEGAIALFISMGAALEFIRLHIASTQGVSDVPHKAVSEYLTITFPHGAEIAEYFEARHEERIISVHPANRFGEFWAPPLMVGDIYHLQKSLFGVYRHILLGEILS